MRSVCLMKRVLRPPDDLILQACTEVDKVVTVAGDSDDQIPVLVRLLLSLSESFGRDHIKLDVVSVQSKIGSNHLSYFEQAFIIGQDLRSEFLIQQCAPGFQMINLGG